MFFHFYTNDETGFVGTNLRYLVKLIPGVQMGLDDVKFATIVISAFMQITGILHMRNMFGPTFSPFWSLMSLFVGEEKPEKNKTTSKKKKTSSKKTNAKNDNPQPNAGKGKKGRKEL